MLAGRIRLHSVGKQVDSLSNGLDKLERASEGLAERKSKKSVKHPLKQNKTSANSRQGGRRSIVSA